MYTLWEPAEEEKKRTLKYCMFNFHPRGITLPRGGFLLLIFPAHSLSFRFGWTDVEVRTHLNTLAPWWMQAGVWCTLEPQSKAGRSSRPAHAYTFGLHALTPFTKTTKATRTAQNQNWIQNQSPHNDIKNKTLWPVTIIISAQRNGDRYLSWLYN